jgi:hypothetical protein
MIYIQSNFEKTLPHHFDVSCVMYGTMDLGLNYKLITYDEVKSGKFDSLIKTNLFCGSVEFLKEVFSRIGITNVSLPRNSNRKHLIMTLDEVKSRVNDLDQKWFIKPLDIKLFTGFVLDKMVYNSIKSIDGNTLVMVYEVFDSPIESEWRIYVDRNKIIDIRNYSDDMFLIPNKEYVQSIINENVNDFPISYVIDVGVLNNGENVVIEFNDMWAIGNYGMDNSDYVSLLKHRYFEIVNQKMFSHRIINNGGLL